MACRNLEKADASRQSIINIIPGADIHIMQLDLSSQKNVADFAAGFKKNYDKLNILINNAGIMAVPYAKTADGFKSHFSLTGMLLKLLNVIPESRIVNISGLAHRLGDMNFENIMYENGKGYRNWSAYSRLKLANLLFSYELQRRLTASGKSTITLTAHPGLARTNIMPNGSKSPFGKVIPKAFSNVFKPPKMGAMPTLRAAVDTAVTGCEYFGRGNKGLPVVAESNKASHNMEDARQLWEISEKITGIRYLD